MIIPSTPDTATAEPNANHAGSWTGQLWHWLRHPAAPAWVLASGAALLLLGTQWPQLRAPWPTADGLPRADLQMLAALGGSTWARSLTVHAWVVAAVGVATAHCWQRLRVDRHGVARRASVALAVVAAVAWLVLDGLTAEPLWVDVPIAAEAGAAGMPIAEAWRNDHGTLAAAAGPYRGRCTPSGSTQLRCRLAGPGLDIETDVGARAAGSAVGVSVHWLATLAAPAENWTWQPPTAGGRSIAVPLRPGHTVAVPDWGHRRAVPVATAVAGPLVLAVGAEGGQLWGAPRLVGRGSPASLGHLRAGARARLLVAGPVWHLPLWLAAIGLLLLAVVATPPRRGAS